MAIIYTYRWRQAVLGDASDKRNVVQGHSLNTLAEKLLYGVSLVVAAFGFSQWYGQGILGAQAVPT